jgi:hypothetical protein
MTDSTTPLRFWDGKSHHWRSIWDYSDGFVSYRNVGVEQDGSLFNPNGYPEDKLRLVIERVFEEKHKRRSAGAKKAAVTRAKRVEAKLYEVVQRLKDGGTFLTAAECEICGKRLDDPQSRARGIGSDCWQRVLDRLGHKSLRRVIMPNGFSELVYVDPDEAEPDDFLHRP